VSAFCPHCGHQTRADDRFCVSCGQTLNPAVKPTGTAAAFRAPSHRRRRVGSFLVSHARGLMALLVIAGIAIAAVAGSSSDTVAGPEDAAPQSAVATETNPQRTEPPTDSEPTTTHKKTTSPHRVTARGADGKTYHCAFAVMDRVDTAKDRVTRRETILKTRRAAVHKLAKQYPSGSAPGYVVDRYRKLLARANAQVAWTNTAIDQYNRVLRDACERA